jgi:hypothetical protein
MLRRQKLTWIILAEAAGCLFLVGLGAWVYSRASLAGLVPPLVTRAALITPSAPPSASPGLLAVAATVTPAPTHTPRPPTRTLTPTPTPGVTARVSESVPTLRLRAEPGTTGAILAELQPLTLLSAVGRTADNTWLQVVTIDDQAGWVSAAYVDVTGDLALLEVTGTAVEAPDSVSYLSGISAHAREVFLYGAALGNRDFAFSLVGDSNTDNPAFLAPFDFGNYDLGAYDHLSPTIRYFAGSFARDSAAAVGSFSTARVLDPAYADGRCQAGESPLACEYRLHKPSVALILLGTGDQHAWQTFEGRYRQIVEYTLAQGIVPVLITKADDLESLENTAPPGFTNSVIRSLAVEYDVPLLDLRMAVEGLPNRGCLPDGFHYNTPPDGRSAAFDDAHLQYGYTVRNLTALQVLDALRLYVLY